MSAVEPETEGKQEFDDSGCVQDESIPKAATMDYQEENKPMEKEYTGQIDLLDLSDDVLLYILKFCSPQDLKSLGFSCARLGRLVLERSLWTHVDAREESTGRTRMRWLLNALHAGTKAVLLTGFAKETVGCQGHVNKTRQEVEQERIKRQQRFNSLLIEQAELDARFGRERERRRPPPPPAEENQNGRGLDPPYPLFRQHARLHINAHNFPRNHTVPYWPEDEFLEPESEPGSPTSEPGGSCSGPVFTLSADMMRELRKRCPHLTTLALDYCNINCNKISPSNFPPTLKRLSLRGTRCYNPQHDKSYLFRIHDYLPNLEYIDLSECTWLEPAALLPLSKLPRLQELLMRDCPAMTEFVAYVSLATRYGFRELKILDLRGSPVGDSEVAALGWLPLLEELYLSAPTNEEYPPHHHHYVGDTLPAHNNLYYWETQIPDYYKDMVAEVPETESPDISVEDVESQVDEMRRRLALPAEHFTLEIHATPRAPNQRNYQEILLVRDNEEEEVEQVNAEQNSEEEDKTKRKAEFSFFNSKNDDEAGPSKRVKRIPSNEESTSSSSCARLSEIEDKSTSEVFPGTDSTSDSDQMEDDDNPRERLDEGRMDNILNDAREIVNDNDAMNNAIDAMNNANDAMNNVNDAMNNAIDVRNVAVNARINEGSDDSVDDNRMQVDVEPDNEQSNERSEENKSETTQKHLNLKELQNKFRTIKCKMLASNNPSTSGINKTKDDDEMDQSGGKNETKEREPDNEQSNERSEENKSETTLKHLNLKELQNKFRTIKCKMLASNNPSTSGINKTKDDNEMDQSGGKNETKERDKEKTDGEDKSKSQELSVGSNESNASNNKSNNKKGDGDEPKPDNDGMSNDGRNSDDDDDDDHDNNQTYKYDINVNDGASTSTYSIRVRVTNNINNNNNNEEDRPALKRSRRPSEEEGNGEEETERANGVGPPPEAAGPSHEARPQQYVRFRRNQQPVVVEQQPRQQQLQPRHHVLYVNLGQQLHAVYRLLPARPHHPADHLAAHHLDTSSIVSDASIRRFGRADGEDVNVVYIGAHGPQVGVRDPSSRPNRSNLRILVATGYRLITNRSLDHLATAAPHLQRIDFTNTGVTSEGVNQFRSLRPNVDIVFSEFRNEDEENIQD